MSKKRANDRIYNIRGLATARKLRTTKAKSGDATPHKQAKLVAYCPVCPPVAQNPPETPHVFGPKRSGSVVVCPKGHDFVIA